MSRKRFMVFIFLFIGGYKNGISKANSKIREKSLIGGYIVYNNTSIQESDKTGDYGVFLANLSHSMKEIEQICKEAGGDISDWLFAAVTEGISYPILEARGIPCGRDYFYLRYRKFFWLLSQVR